MNIGDKVNITDDSYGFGIQDGKLIKRLSFRGNLTIIQTGMYVMRDANSTTRGEYRQQNDLLVTDGNGNFWFTQSRFCKPIDKKIEVKYFCDGEDITDSISDETKQAVRAVSASRTQRG